MTEFTRFYFKPAAGEQIETIVHTDSDKRCAICGTVLDKNERPVDGAIVLLQRAGDDGGLLSRMFTDTEGKFVFGPLEPDILHLIKIYKNGVKLRELEIRTE